MNIDEMRKLKTETETKIRELINEFEEKTSLGVEAINNRYDHVVGQHYTITRAIILEVNL